MPPDLDLGSGHMAYRRASLIDFYLHTKFHSNSRNFLWTDRETSRQALLGRLLGGVDLLIQQNEHLFHRLGQLTNFIHVESNKITYSTETTTKFAYLHSLLTAPATESTTSQMHEDEITTSVCRTKSRPCSITFALCLALSIVSFLSKAASLLNDSCVEDLCRITVQCI